MPFFFFFVLLGNAYSKISLHTKRIWKRKEAAAVREEIEGTANKGSWTCTRQWGAARVGQCDCEKALPPLAENSSQRRKYQCCTHFTQTVKEEMWKRKRWLKTVNSISKDSWGLSVLTSLCEWRYGQGSSFHVYRQVFYHYICSPVQLRWLWSHLLESVLCESCIYITFEGLYALVNLFFLLLP